MSVTTPINGFSIPKQFVPAQTTKNTEKSKDSQPAKQIKLHHTKTHAGLICGLTTSVAGLFLLKKILPLAAVIPLSVLSPIGGGLTDFLINKKNKKVVEQNKNKTAEEIFLSDKKFEPTKKQNIYYETNTGKKAGAAIGAGLAAIIPPLMGIIDSIIEKQPSNIKNIFKALATLDGIKHTSMFSAAGLILGYINGGFVDFMANIKAKRTADKMAEATNNAVS